MIEINATLDVFLVVFPLQVLFHRLQELNFNNFLLSIFRALPLILKKRMLKVAAKLPLNVKINGFLHSCDG